MKKLILISMFFLILFCGVNSVYAHEINVSDSSGEIHFDVSSKDVCMIAASYSGNLMTEVNIATENEESQTASLKKDDNLNYRAFLLESKDSLLPLESKLYIGNRVMINSDFESEHNFQLYARDNVIEPFTDESGNTSVLFERTEGNTKDFHMDCPALSTNSDICTYEFDIYPDLIKDVAYVFIKDNSNHYSTLCSFSTAGIMSVCGVKYRPALNEKYHIRAVYNYKNRTRDFYVDSVPVVIGASFETAFCVDDVKPALLRIHIQGQNKVSLRIDNLKAYEGAFERSNIINEEISAPIFDTSAVFGSDVAALKSLDGFYAVQLHSGSMYANGSKVILTNKPLISAGKSYVPVEEMSALFGSKSKAENTGEYDVLLKDGVLYMQSDEFFGDYMGLKVYKGNQSATYGLVICGSSMYEPKNSDDIQRINNFLFYERPSTKDISGMLCDVSAIHPRLQMNDNDFLKLGEEIKNNAYKKERYTQLIKVADKLTYVNTEPLKYELRDGVRLLYVARDALRHMYVLAMAYRLTGNESYAQRAWADLEAVCSFNDWNPSHELDVAEMSAAVAIGYDWLYEALTDEQRRFIEDAVYKNAIYDYCASYQTPYGRLGDSVISDYNHNIVMNGGAIMLSVAFADAYPEECAYILSNSLRALEYVMYRWAPDGAWFEGAGYWEYAMQYTAKAISSLRTCFGTDFNMSLCPGLSGAAEYIFAVQSETGLFNYSDSPSGNIYVPEIFWLADIYDCPQYAAYMMSKNKGIMNEDEDVVLSLMWYNPEFEKCDIADLPLDNSFEDVCTMRSSLEDENMTFLGVHGGLTQHTHSHLDAGSFVYDYGGVRWAKDYGGTDYNLTGNGDYSANGGRWKLFKIRAEAHNTIVINPDENPDHSIDSYAKVSGYSLNEFSPYAVVDMSQVLKKNASGAKRGVRLCDERKSAVIRDEISLLGDEVSDVYWFMQTDAEVTTDKTGAVLTQNGRSVRLDFISDCEDVQISCEKAFPLATSPHIADDEYPDSKRIAIHLKAKGNLNLTVKLTPCDIEGTDVSDYNKSIKEWR